MENSLNYKPTPVPILIVSQHDSVTPEKNHPLVVCPQGLPKDINPTRFLEWHGSDSHAHITFVDKSVSQSQSSPFSLLY